MVTNSETAALAFHNSRLANQVMAPLRKLTALELLGRSPVPITIPEFPDAVFYFAHPRASKMKDFFTTRDRIMEAMKAKGEGELTVEAVSRAGVEFIEMMRVSQCELLASILVNEDGTPVFPTTKPLNEDGTPNEDYVSGGQEVANEMSRENFQIFTREMLVFLGMSPKVQKNVTPADEAMGEKSDEEIRSDLITLEDELDADYVTTAEGESDHNPNA